MIEYLYNCIVATADTDTEITAKITDDEGNFIKENCSLMLHSKDEEMIASIDGRYTTNGIWEFVIPKSLTLGKQRRYWYCICHSDSNLCFKQPIYFK